MDKYRKGWVIDKNVPHNKIYIGKMRLSNENFEILSHKESITKDMEIDSS